MEFNTAVALEEKQQAAEAEKMLQQAVSRKKHIREVQEQIAEKEKNLYNERKAFFQAGINADKDREERAKKIRDIKNRKIAELHKQGVPQQYIDYVEREAFEEKPQT